MDFPCSLDSSQFFWLNLGGDFPDLGQLAGYVAMVDDLLNSENAVLARYALTTELPDDLKNALPTPEEIENGLKNI